MTLLLSIFVQLMIISMEFINEINLVRYAGIRIDFALQHYMLT